MPRLIDATEVVKAILAERDKIPRTIHAAPYELGIEKPYHAGDQMRGGIRKALRCIEQAPTVAAVPVVRCRECKLWHEETGFCEKNSYFVDGDGVCCSPADSPNWTMFNPDDFCSYGERKEGAD